MQKNWGSRVEQAGTRNAGKLAWGKFLIFASASLSFLLYKLTLCVSRSVVSDSLWPHGLYSLPSSSVFGIFQARILEWVAISFSRGSSQPRDRTWVSCIAVRCFTIWATTEAPKLTLMMVISSQLQRRLNEMCKVVWASLVAQLVKNLPVMQKTLVWFLGLEDPLEKG